MRSHRPLTRRQVLDICYAARTLPAIEAAFDARGRWLSEHPDDGEVFEVGEMLAMMRDGLELEAKDPRAQAHAAQVR